MAKPDTCTRSSCTRSSWKFFLKPAIAAAVVFAGLSGSVQTASAQGFLEHLFSRGDRVYNNDYVYRDRYYDRYRARRNYYDQHGVEAERRYRRARVRHLRREASIRSVRSARIASVAKVAKAGAGPSIKITIKGEGLTQRKYTPPPVLPGKYGQFLADSTLRPGDVVVTKTGLAVFTGKVAAFHKAKHFKPLASNGKYVKSHRNKLQAIARANRLRNRALVKETSVANYKPANDSASTKKLARLADGT